VALLAGLTGTVIFCGTYAAIISNRTFPVTEGWWSVFAKYINEGKVLYRDVELLTTPAYAYLIAGVTATFGYDIIVLRVVGVLLFIAIAAIAYLIFVRLFSPGIAVVATCLTALFMQSEVNNVFYDYIRFFDFFTFAATLFLLVYVSGLGRPSARGVSWAVTLSGLCSGAAILIRQSSGVVDAVYIVVLLAAFIFALDHKRDALLNLANYVISLLIPVAAAVGVMMSNGSFVGFLEATTGRALAAKGGVFVVLTGWLDRTVTAMIAQVGPIALLVYLLVISGLLFARRHQETVAGTIRMASRSMFFFSAAFVGILLCFTQEPLAGAFASLDSFLGAEAIYAVVVLLFAGSLWSLRGGGRLGPEHRPLQLQSVALTGLTVAMGYGSALSSGLSRGETSLALGTIFGTVLFLGRGRVGSFMNSFAVGLAVLLCVSFASYKFEHPYAWWGLEEPSTYVATEKVGLPLLTSIRVSNETRVAIEGVAHAITASSQVGDNVFVFPNIPIFYLLTNRYPRTFTLVQWFDFSSRGALASDTDRIKKDPPRVIVIADVPGDVYDAHEFLFDSGQKSPTRQMRDALRALISEKHYRLVGNFILNGDYPISVWATGVQLSR
jgi:hypothetical protein